MSFPTRIPYMCFDSSDVRLQERYEYLQHSLSNVCQLSLPEHLPLSRFSARNEMWMLGDLLFTQRTCSAHVLERSARSIRFDQVDHYKVHVRVSDTASTNFTAGERRIRLGAGQCIMTDMSRPEHVSVESGSTIAVIIPRGRLDALLARPVHLHGVVLRGSASVLLASHLQTLALQISDMVSSELPLVTDATLHLLAASIAPSIDTLALASSTIDNALCVEIRRFIERHITSPSLSPDLLCKQFCMSRASLYRLFEPLGGVARYIKERRLVQIHKLLAASPQRLHMGRLAEHHGFKSAAHFSRVFRQQFGYAPSDLVTKGRALTGKPYIPTPASYSLERWLHALWSNSMNLQT
jgi:AraC-like DNA-binding protein